MKKKKLNQIIQNAREAEQDDLKLLEKLQIDHPYSQVIHAVTAKTHILFKSEKAQKKLGQAAMYSADRTILKNYIQEIPAGKPVKTNNEPTKPIEKNNAKIKPPPIKSETPDESIKAERTEKKKPKFKEIEPLKPYVPTEHDLEMDKLREEVIQNAIALQKNVEKYKLSEAGIESGKSQPVSEKEFDENKKTEEEITNKAAPSETTEAVNEKDPEDDVPEDGYIFEISKIEEKTLGPRQAEQNKVIDAFIEKKPKISTPKETPSTIEEETMDLARESVHFKDDLISENLAVIMAKQGKKSKAIDIYRKLIWKYPQKKAYFAGQIENLEKS